MIRVNAREFPTPFGTFYGGVYRSQAENGPTFYAETESGEVTVNNVTYSGTIYFERYRSDGSLFASCQHLTRWDDKRGHHYPPSDSARQKLSDALLPQIEALATDAEYVRQCAVKSVRSSMEYAIVDANRDIGKANEYAAQLRELGEDVSDYAYAK